MPHRLLVLAASVAAVLVAAPTARADWVWPVQGDVITPYRNGDDPYAAGQHRGIDIAAPVGTPVVAAVGGEVRFAGTAGSSGLTVSIRSADGRFDTSYLHLSARSVRKGDRVAAGDRVGAVGTTGTRSATAAHLHFGVRDAGSRHAYHEPLAFLPPAPTGPEHRPAPEHRPEPEHPRPPPVPTPAPAPAVPEPAPGPEPAPVAPNPGRVPEPAPRARPTRPVPRPLPRPRSHPRPLPRGLPSQAPTPRNVPHAAPHRAPQLGPAPRGAPAGAPADGGRARSSPQAGANRPAPHAPGPAHDRAAGEPGTTGPDIGYVLACVGLLLAAALLGLSEGGRRATRRNGARIAAALRPVVGRR